MSLNLMYITNKPAIAKIAEESGIDWIFVDMEFIGKDNRQGGLDTVKNHHTIEDVKNIKAIIKTSKLIVRINPIHDSIEDYFSSKDEIEATIEAGADIIMLPFFHTVEEVKDFIKYVNGRIKTCLLLETPEAVGLLDEILKINGIDMIHIGLNDLHLAMGMKFMFELLTVGVVEKLAEKFRNKNIPFGFGGIAGLNSGMLPGSYVLKEHYRLGSSMVIVSRSFCNTDHINNLEEVRRVFKEGITEIRTLESEAQAAVDYFTNNKKQVKESVDRIVNLINSK